MRRILQVPGFYEQYVESAIDYVAMAKQRNGPIRRSTDFCYINLETSVTRSDDYMPKGSTTACIRRTCRASARQRSIAAFSPTIMSSIAAARASRKRSVRCAMPAGVGRRGLLDLSNTELDAMLEGGAQWALRRGFGNEANGRIAGAKTACRT